MKQMQEQRKKQEEEMEAHKAELMKKLEGGDDAKRKMEE